MGGGAIAMTVQQGDSCREKVVPEPTGPGTEDPVTPSRGEEGKLG